jgi:hypothetical protein
MKDYLSRLPNDFPDELLQKGKSLKHIGLSCLVWNRENALEVVEFFSTSDYAILGGDVYVMSGSNMKSTSDSWFVDENDVSWDEYVNMARNKANVYINQYNNNNGDNFYYSIIFSDKGKM